MTDNRVFLAFDCGATSGRGVLATFEGGRFQMKEVYPFGIGKTLPQLEGCWFYCKGTGKRMRDLARDFGLPK